MKRTAWAGLIVVFSISNGWIGCTHKVQIEPSDKPFVVNLNVKVDHEVRHKVESQNKDLLNLEEEALGKTKSSSSKGGKR